ncbi:MAG: class I SAM-dependent methyltransferase [Myxococcota bacterium]
MGYWDEAKNIEDYERMAEGYDGRALVDYLATQVPASAHVLELGMGPGKDLDMMRERGWTITGSDASAVFVDRYLGRHPGADVLALDAVTIKTDRTFDVIYSNKVLQHLTREQMRHSLARQVECLNVGGVCLHALWYGEEVQEHHGLRFTQYTEALVREVLPVELELVEILRYTEMEEGDSLRVLLRRTTS